jgi:exopolysaccharide biosynthesis polyprenyl glycosylphosphotransferase
MRGGAVVYPAADVASLWASVTLSFHLRFKTGLIPIFTVIPNFSAYIIGLLVLTPLYVFILHSLGAYEPRHGRLSSYEMQNLYRSLASFYVLSLVVILMLHGYEVSRLTVVLSFLINVLLCILFRWLLIRSGLGVERARVMLIGGDPEFMAEVMNAFETNPGSGQQVVETATIENEQPVKVDYDKVDRILIVGGRLPFSTIADLVLDAPPRIHVGFIPAYHIFLRNLPFKEFIGDLPVLSINQRIFTDWNSFAKRIIDVFISAITLIVLSPLLLLIAACIRLTSGGPVLFRQSRVGQNGRLFTMYKFRTMKMGAEKEISDWIAAGKQTVFKFENDLRIENSFARFLRRSSLDELPQLWNVLRGAMSLVGPRPEQVELVRNYTAEHKLRLAVPPGITGLQQIYCRGVVSMEERLKYDFEYIKEQSVWLDLLILFKTIWILLSGKGAS